MNFSRTTPAHCGARTERGNRTALGASLSCVVPVALQARTFSKAGCWNVGAQVVREPISRSDAENRVDKTGCFAAFRPEIPQRASGINFESGGVEAGLRLARGLLVVWPELHAMRHAAGAAVEPPRTTATTEKPMAPVRSQISAWPALFHLPSIHGGSAAISLEVAHPSKGIKQRRLPPRSPKGVKSGNVIPGCAEPHQFEHAPLPADKRDGATSPADALNRKAVTVAACSTTFRANGGGECALVPNVVARAITRGRTLVASGAKTSAQRLRAG